MTPETLPKINPDLIKKHLDAVARPRDIFQNPETLREVQIYIEDELISYGYQIYRDLFRLEGQTFENVVATSASSLQQKRFIIGAHFDAVAGTHGADDNASGIAAMLEAARILSNSTVVSKIDFVAFNAEEHGVTGSACYAGKLKETGAKLFGMISLEMVGFTAQGKGSQQLPFFLRPFYPDIGNFLALVGDHQSSKLLQTAKKAFSKVEALPVETLSVPAKGRMMPETRLSDHANFWDAGYPALLVTDTSFFRNPHYHKPTDRVETLDLEFLARVTEGVAHLAFSI